MPCEPTARCPDDADAFDGFWMGGYEGADHVNTAGRPLDMAASTGHLALLEDDHSRAAKLGLRAVRESIGWRLAEPAPGRYELERAVAIAHSARRHGLQVLWTLMHYGTPTDVDLRRDDWIPRFAAFAAAVARTLAPLSPRPPVYTPVNEIGFVAWAVSATDRLHPYRGGDGRGDSVQAGEQVKRILVRATLAAMHAIRQADPRARFLHVEPLVHVVPPAGRPELAPLARRIAAYQWQAWDWLSGRREPELGGHPGALDLLGLNHYHDGQWEALTERRLHWHTRDPRRRPFGALAARAWRRYRRPMLVAETSHFGAGRAQWLHEIATEVALVRRRGIPVQGLCLYPLVDRHDWNDADHWHASGLWDRPQPASGAPATRRLAPDYAAALAHWRQRLPQGLPPTGTPMPPHATRLIVFSHLRWGFVWQRPQHLLSRLAPHLPVTFVEEPVHRAGPAGFTVTRHGEHLEVLTPHTPVEAPGFHDDQLAVLRPMLAERLREQAVTDYAVWFYTPMALPLLAGLAPRAVVYDCMDELAAFKDAPRQLRQRETALLRSADLVFTGGPALYELKKRLHPNVHCLPSAVDPDHYAPANLVADSDAARAVHALQGALPRPRLGYFGVIDERLDLGLVDALAAARPQWQVVMVGPVAKIDPAALPRRPNLHWLGMQAYDRLPHLLAGWDVALMPFALNEATRYISPTKTLEYMAGERPVVSTPVHDVVALYGDVVHVAPDRHGFVDACDALLSRTPAERHRHAGEMLSTVLRASWQHSADCVLRLLRAELEKPRRVRETVLPAEATAPAEPEATQIVVSGTVASRARTPRRLAHLVVGAGPAGLAAALHLGDEGETLVVEREAQVGGGWRGHEAGPWCFAAGPLADATQAPWIGALCQQALGVPLQWQSPRAAAWHGTLDGGRWLPCPVEGPLQALQPDERPDTMIALAPQGGRRALLDGLVALLPAAIATKTRVLQVFPREHAVRLDDGRLLHYETMVATLPLPSLVAACGDEVPATVRAAAAALRPLSERCVQLGVRLGGDAAERPLDRHWLHLPDGHLFHRVRVASNFGGGLAPPGGVGLVFEIAYAAGRPLPCDGAALVERVVEQALRLGLLQPGDDVEFAQQLDRPEAALLADAAQAAALATLRDWFAGHGIVLAGRSAQPGAAGDLHPFELGRLAALQARTASSVPPSKVQTG